MVRKFLLILLASLCLQQILNAQNCTTPGQRPETAFPVCASAPFPQTSVPVCAGNILTAPGCSGVELKDMNPYYYKFTCFTAGTLGFSITPVNLSDDYDWQLFDVTNHSPADIYTDPSLFVACNWSGEPGVTGASSAGGTLVVCATTTGGPFRPLFTSMPTLVAGHNYLLMISHFTGSDQSGYSLAFNGGTAVITDPADPHLASVRAACDGTVMYVKLNKKMKCNSLAANGSDFSINTPLTNIIAASGIGCSTGFDTDSIMLTLNNPLPPGTYTLSVKNGTDANTLKDNCDREIPIGENRNVTIFPVFPTPMDSITTPGCAPQTLQIYFAKPIKCSSIAPNGSNFTITGPYPVTVTGASGNCGTSGLSNTITLQLAAPMQVQGNFLVTLTITVIDECGQATPVGDNATFSVKDTVNADFTYQVLFGCKKDTINYSHNGLNGVNNWAWSFDNMFTSTLQNPQQVYSTFDEKTTKLIVTNGVCSDTTQVKIYLDNYVKAAFEATPFVCPQEPGKFMDQSLGNISAWEWDFGNGNTSALQNPPPQNYVTRLYKYNATVTLIVTNSIGCKDTATKELLVIDNCYIAVPSAFTPNSDGLNDQLYPLNAYKSKDLTFAVYNRFGQRMFYTNDWNIKWDGNFKGQPADAGTYVWFLTYTNTDNQQRVEQKGTSILIR